MVSDYDEIRKNNIEEYGKGTRHLSLLGRMYSDRTHFIFELLQNAEDAGASKVLFDLHEDRLEYFHDGKEFDSNDVRGISGVGESVKVEDVTKIGRFGVGFKSVYAYTQRPEVFSGAESFYIDNYVRPYGLEGEVVEKPWTTKFRFPFSNEVVEPEVACSEIIDRLKGLSARTLLFLDKISEIRWETVDGHSGVYKRETVENAENKNVRVTGSSDFGVDESEDWLVYSRETVLPNGGSSKPVEIAYSLIEDKQTKKKIVQPITDSPLVVFFPTEKETGLGFMMQGPYKTTPARDNIPKDDEWNKFLVNETATLVVDSLCHMRDEGLLTVDVLQSMPIREDSFSDESMFLPIFERVMEAFYSEKIIPTDDQEYVSAQSAKLGRGAGLRKLLDCKGLSQLLNDESDIKWITSRITQELTPAFRTYLMRTLDVEEITPEIFSNRLTPEFLSKQSDDWMVNFYKFISTQAALWRKVTGTWARDGVLRKKEFVRLEDNSHVAPFNEKDLPQVYFPVEGLDVHRAVKKVLVDDKDVREFFTNLGVRESDLVAEVIENILPNYSGNDINISNDDHHRHVNMIVSGFKTDSVDRRLLLKRALSDLQFVIGENAKDGNKSYLNPEDLYVRTKELECYFKGNDEIWFLSDEYEQDQNDLFQDLGMSLEPIVSQKAQNVRGYVVVANHHGWHSRGLHGFDPGFYVDGLEEAIETVSIDKALYIWNNIVVPYEKQLKGVVESSTKQTYENSTKQTRYSVLGKLVAENSWLPRNGEYVRPDEVSLADLPDDFDRSESVATLLLMKGSELDQIAKRVGVDPEDLELLKKLKENPKEYERVRLHLDKIKNKPEFPVNVSKNPERRQKKVREYAKDASQKTYEKKERSVRVTNDVNEVKTQLRDWYLNDNDQLVCQMCEEEMPFRKRDGEYYFEAVEIFSILKNEYEENYAALCPVCAAKYKEYIKSDESKQKTLLDEIVQGGELSFELFIGDHAEYIRFVNVHHLDLVAILSSDDT